MLNIMAKRLQTLRQAREATQEEVANVIGITGAGYRGIEIGRRKPSLDVLLALADYYDVSLDYLCGRDRYLER